MFNKNLKNILKIKGVSQRELAELTETTEVSISRYVNGKRSPSIITAHKIADALGVTIDELIRG